jgi:hypothetical protein
MASTCTTTSGGKNPGAAGPGKILEPGKALLEKTFAPQANDLSARAEAISDLVVGQTLVREKDHLGSYHLIIR